MQQQKNVLKIFALRAQLHNKYDRKYITYMCLIGAESTS